MTSSIQILRYQHPLKSFDERVLTCTVLADDEHFADFMQEDRGKYTELIVRFLEQKYGSLESWEGHVDFSMPEVHGNPDPAPAIELTF